jgi:hypothetical protein
MAPNTPGVAKPDLVITEFGMYKWGTCAPGQMIYHFLVSVKNQGTGTWAPGKEPAVTVKDMHLANPGDWGAGVGIAPPLKPGEMRTIPVDVMYFAADPGHMTSAAPHPFRAMVNENKAVDESNFGNNAGTGAVTWNGMQVIQMGAPENCPFVITRKPTPTPHVIKGVPLQAAPLAPTPTPIVVR